MSKQDFMIGTRGSPLALAQAHATRAALCTALSLQDSAVTLNVIKTTGDAITDRPLSEAGGKGLFTKEIDAAQLAGEIDIAVHSAKDLPTQLPDGLVIAGYLPREDVRDVFIGANVQRLIDLPIGAIIGSASLRRQAQVRRLRPDLQTTLLRGNVGTRLTKVMRGEIAGTLLALAGLRRLDLAHKATEILNLEEFLPAPGQGAIAIVTRTNDSRTKEAIARMTCRATGIALACERAFLGVLDGSCRTPIAGHAHLVDGQLTFRGEVLHPEGTAFINISSHGDPDQAAAIGTAAGRELRAKAQTGPLAGVLTGS
jgi:hydroxymethylbilane synthase